MGCQDIDECEDPNMNSCVRICRNIPGNYTCSCPNGYFGDGRKKGSGCIAETSHFSVIKFSLGMGFGFFAILAGLTWFFGVVLAELLTGKKPVLKNGREEMILAKLFVTALEENRLFQILELRVVREGTLEQLQEIAELVKRCLNLSGDDRPTMKSVVIQLEGIRKFTQHPWAIPHEILNLTSTQSNQVDLYSCTM
ncbi:hypothetical protein L1987_32357 [Smallanthus sonchifolius]|uniref:Uncharacterized protein n=1 Tax=Smallanthus sonchifolius TaxID=185202 RepID=A0ACB9I9D4_9ASTR|nr:hypothetical protein L1987_32357 [Smallanthus sonchifolius]